MTRYGHQISGSIPAARRGPVNIELEQHGYGPDSFSVPLENPGGQIQRYGTEWLMDAVAKMIVNVILIRPQNGGDMQENERINQHAQRHGLSKRPRG